MSLRRRQFSSRDGRDAHKRRPAWRARPVRDRRARIPCPQGFSQGKPAGSRCCATKRPAFQPDTEGFPTPAGRKFLSRAGNVREFICRSRECPPQDGSSNRFCEIRTHNTDILIVRRSERRCLHGHRRRRTRRGDHRSGRGVRDPRICSRRSTDTVFASSARGAFDLRSDFAQYLRRVRVDRVADEAVGVGVGGDVDHLGPEAFDLGAILRASRRRSPRPAGASSR